jgi:transposase
MARRLDPAVLYTGSRLQSATLQSVLDHIAASENNTEVERATGVARKTVRKIRLNLEYWGTPYPPRTVQLGRPSILRNAQRARFKIYLEGRPSAYLEEMKDFLYDEFDVKISISGICRELYKMNYSRKVATKRAQEQSDPLRRVYLARVAQHYTADQIVALDESACNERTGDRKYGWSPTNTSVELVYSFKRSERWSILPAMTINGYMSYTVFQGAFTSELMEEFLEYQVLPFCNPHPAPNSVIVLDNASIHRSARVRQLCEAAGVRLEYLPPYSPDYNPIEKSFKQLKGWIKLHADEADTFNEFGAFIQYAIQRVCCEIDCRAWFRKCGYPI